MEIIRNRPSRVMELPIDGAGSDIKEGAVIMPGVTDETDRSVFIKASSGAADAVGLLATLHDYSVVGDSTPEDGLVLVKHPIIPFLPGCEVAAEFADSASDDVDVASATSTVITITSMEDDIEGGWLYVRAGTGVGQLEYITAAATTGATIKSASTTTLDNTSKLILMRPVGWQLVSLNSDADKLTTANTAGALPWRVIGLQFKHDGLEEWTDLDYRVHHNLQLDGLHAKFRAILVPADTFYNPVN